MATNPGDLPAFVPRSIHRNRSKTYWPKAEIKHKPFGKSHTRLSRGGKNKEHEAVEKKTTTPVKSKLSKITKAATSKAPSNGGAVTKVEAKANVKVDDKSTSEAARKLRQQVYT